MDCTTLKEIVLTIAAIVGSGVAIIGLTTWRRQLAGTVEYELARRLLKEVYQFREALQSVRFPGGSITIAALKDKEKRYQETREKYVNRYRKVNEARAALDLTLLEVEVLWGVALCSKVQGLYKHDGKLYAFILDYLRAIQKDNELDASTEDIIFCVGDKDKDDFLKKLQQDIQEIEKEVKPYLRRFVSVNIFFS